MLKDRNSEANHLGRIGEAFSDLEEEEKAIGYFERALRISREMEDRTNEATYLIDLAFSYSALELMEPIKPS